MAVDFIPPWPLQVEILELASPAQDFVTTSAADSDYPLPTGAAPVSKETIGADRRPRNVSAAPVTGPDLQYVPERYFTSREVDVRAEPLNDIPLVYPQLAYQRRIRGIVLLSIRISQRGEVDGISVAGSEPPGVFEDAALDAARALKFSPAIRHGRPVKSQKMLEVAFDPYETIHIP